jgi:hypothetical protein
MMAQARDQPAGWASKASKAASLSSNATSRTALAQQATEASLSNETVCVCASKASKATRPPALLALLDQRDFVCVRAVCADYATAATELQLCNSCNRAATDFVCVCVLCARQTCLRVYCIKTVRVLTGLLRQTCLLY